MFTSLSHPPTSIFLTLPSHKFDPQLLSVEALLPFLALSVWQAEKVSQEEISNPITRGAFTPAAATAASAAATEAAAA